MIPYVEDFLTLTEADSLEEFVLSLTPVRPLTIPWGKPSRKVSYGCYSALPESRTGKTVNGGGASWLATAPEEIQLLAARVTAYAGVEINYLSLLGYENEKDHIGFHNHSEDLTLKSQAVYVISLGQDRELTTRPVGCKDKSEYERLTPAHGSLYVLPHAFNTTHEHAVLDSKTPCGLRISINCKHIDDEYLLSHQPLAEPEPYVRKPGPPRIYNASGAFPTDAVYAGRGGVFKGRLFPPSPYGNYNKHALKTDEGRVAWTREVTEKLLDPAFRIQLETLRGKDLICHCSPKEIKAGECHAMWWLARANKETL